MNRLSLARTCPVLKSMGENSERVSPKTKVESKKGDTHWRYSSSAWFYHTPHSQHFDNFMATLSVHEIEREKEAMRERECVCLRETEWKRERKGVGRHALLWVSLFFNFASYTPLFIPLLSSLFHPTPQSSGEQALLTSLSKVKDLSFLRILRKHCSISHGEVVGLVSVEIPI